MECNIIPQMLWTAYQGNIQCNIPLCPMAIPPLAAHLTDLYLGIYHTKGMDQWIYPIHSSGQSQQCFLTRACRQKRNITLFHPGQRRENPMAAFLDHLIRPLQRTAQWHRQTDPPTCFDPQIQIFHPLAHQHIGQHPSGRVHDPYFFQRCCLPGSFHHLLTTFSANPSRSFTCRGVPSSNTTRPEKRPKT